MTPQITDKKRQVVTSVDNPIIGTEGRFAAIFRAVNPLFVKQTTSAASSISAAAVVANAMASSIEC